MAVNKESQLFKKNTSRWKIVLAASITLATGLVSFYGFSQFRSLSTNQSHLINPTQPTQPTKPKLAVTALGRLQPEGKVTSLSAPNSSNGVRVEKLMVKEGDEVNIGQILAYLDDYARSQASLEQAQNKLAVAKAKLAQVKSGAKPGDIHAQQAAIANLASQLRGDVAAQRATINRIQAEVDNATMENHRYQKLHQEGAVSASVADSKALVLKTTQQQLTEAQASLQRTQDTLQDQLKQAGAKLNSIKEVRTVDVDAAKTEVASAATAIKQAKADQDLTYIKSPIDGKILKIHAKTGEVITNAGFAEIGKISKIYVIAEVYQTDLQKVQVGQKATIRSTAFPGKLQGTVQEIGWQVEKQSIFSINPTSDTDRKVVEVKISIDNPADSQKVERFTNLQVDVAIHI